MADAARPKPGPGVFDQFLRAQGLALHARDKPPSDLKDWEQRRAELRRQMFRAMGPLPEQPCPLEEKMLGVVQRHGYRIEKLVFQSRPDVWVTANAYVPAQVKNQVPAVLVVHGHWAWARIDPVVQARCLGLVKLGFFVLAVDAFGAGERYTTPAPGTYHGALYGSTLWPAGHTLLGMQLYDNRRAVDYLASRHEVDINRLGITGASGGGNQTMYAGALDERLGAVVPVCSVGTYQSYLHVACCVCEVLPGALRFAEEGDVLALVAPRALLVVNATQDGYQFSPGQAAQSVERARAVFKLHGSDKKLRHALFESKHDYNQPMREAMYGWMMRWLLDEGDGKPIPERKFQLEKPEDLRCYPDGLRPKGFLFPPSFAAREARALLAKFGEQKVDHPEQWESAAVYIRSQLRKQVFGDFPKPPEPSAELGKPETIDQVRTLPLLLYPEPDMPVPALLRSKARAEGRQPTCVLLHLDGKAEALKHPVAAALVKQGWAVAAPDLRATGETRLEGDTIGAARDHNSAEHALWIGRPLLGQWVFDVLCLLAYLGMQPSLDRRRLAVAGIGPAGVVALCAAGLFDDRVASAAAIAGPVTYVTDQPYGPGMRMGLLAPGILRLGDIPQFAALVAPRRLLLTGGVTPQDSPLQEKELKQAYAFTNDIYRTHKANDRLTITAEAKPEEIAATL